MKNTNVFDNKPSQPEAVRDFTSPYTIVDTAILENINFYRIIFLYTNTFQHILAKNSKFTG